MIHFIQSEKITLETNLLMIESKFGSELQI